MFRELVLCWGLLHALRDGPHRLAVLGQSQAKHREHRRNLSVVCLLEDQVYLPTMPPALGSLPCRKCFHQRWRRSFPFKISSVGPVLRKKMLNGRRRDTRRLLWVRCYDLLRVKRSKPVIKSFVFVFYESSLQHLAQWLIVSLKDPRRDLSFDVLAWFGVLARDHQIKSGSFSLKNVLDCFHVWFTFVDWFWISHRNTAAPGTAFWWNTGNSATMRRRSNLWTLGHP